MSLVEMQHRDEQTLAAATPVRELVCGREADIYTGRRLAVKQMALVRGGVLGERQHRKHWLTIYVLDGHIEVRLFRHGNPDPYHATVLTPRAEPLLVPSSTLYEIAALTEVNLMLILGNYESTARVTFADVARVLPDEARSI